MTQPALAGSVMVPGSGGIPGSSSNRTSGFDAGQVNEVNAPSRGDSIPARVDPRRSSSTTQGSAWPTSTATTSTEPWPTPPSFLLGPRR